MPFVVHRVPFSGTVSTRNVVVVAVLAFVLAACEPVTAPTTTTTTLDVLPPPDPISSSTSTSAPSPATTLEPPRFRYQGLLPSGTNFSATIPGQTEDLLMVVNGVFNVDTESGLIPVGEVRYTRVLGPPEVGYHDGILTLWAEPWLVEVVFEEATTPDLTTAPFGAGIELATINGLPVLDLSAPYTWEGANPQLRYVSFVVATGCRPEAARCTDNHAVQVISADDIFIGGAGLSDFQVDAMTLSTTSSRPEHDPYYLDPGLLTERNSAAVIWTGEEMIVWGGKEDRDGVPGLIDGAAFNPETNQWRVLARFPYLGSFGARAIWGDREMLVVSSEGTLSYDPDGDSWREIGEGLIPPEYNDRMLYLDGVIYVWDRAFSMHRMDIDVGMWEPIDAPDAIAGTAEAWAGVLRMVNDQVVAITVNSTCQAKQFWVLTEDGWAPLPNASLATAEVSDCSSANQTASLGEDLVIWDAYYTLAKRYLAGNTEWTDVPPIPLDGTEGASGPVAMDIDRFMVPRWGEGAVFDARTGDWTQIDLPGSGTDAEIIWTGEEFLAWGIYDSFDAWRFAPPPGFAGGDDTS